MERKEKPGKDTDLEKVSKVRAMFKAAKEYEKDSREKAQEAQGELILESFKSLMKGGEHGAIVIAGKPRDSRGTLSCTEGRRRARRAAGGFEEGSA